MKFAFRAPDTPSSRRVHEAWGDGGYIVYAERKDGSMPWIIPFSSVNLDVTVVHAAGNVPVGHSKGCPYMVSSETGDCGVTFKPSPGAELELTIASRGTEPLPAGDLVVEPFLDGAAKDRLVGVMIDSDLRPFVTGLATFGIVLLIASAVVAMNST